MRKGATQMPQLIVHFMGRADCLQDLTSHRRRKLAAQPVDVRLDRA